MHMRMWERERGMGEEGGSDCVIILKVSQDTGTVSQKLRMKRRRRRRMRKWLEGEWVDVEWGLDTGSKGCWDRTC